MRRRLRLRYRAPFDFAALLAFFARRAIAGIEHVDGATYRRRFVYAGTAGMLQVSACAGVDALGLTIEHPDSACVADVRARIRRMFDVDADIGAIRRQLGRDVLLRGYLRRNPGQRVPGGWDGFEIAVRAVLGQQISVAAARTLATRLVQRYGVRARCDDGTTMRGFPLPRTLARAAPDSIGLTRARARTLVAVARAVCDGSVDFCRDQPLEEFVSRWTQLPGIGAWTAHYIAMRALGHADAFPAADLVLRKAVSPGETLAARELQAMAEAWRPWRAYAVLHLWRGSGG